MHVAGLERLGATVRSEHGFLIATRDERLHGANVWLDFPSVGATENLLMAAVLAKGTTVIDNAAREPEIVDICTMLVAMGAQIDGDRYVDPRDRGRRRRCRPTEHTTVPDRLVVGHLGRRRRDDRAATSRSATPIAGTSRSRSTSCAARVRSVDVLDDGFRVQCFDRPTAVDVVTLPYPGFPTDLQPQFIALNSIARRRRDGHREPVRGAVPVRQRDGAPRRRRPHRRAPRHGARPRERCRARRSRPPTSVPAPASCSPVSSPRA